MLKRIQQLCGILFTLVSFQAIAEIKLTFGVYTSDKPTTMVTTFRPIMNALEKSLSAKLNEPVSIRMQVAKSYDQGINDLVNGKIDFARMGPASYILSKEKQPGIRLLAMENNKGKKEFFGIIAVHANSSITHVSQLKNHSFAFGNKNSTIGRYLSQLFLIEHGITAKNLASFDYLDRHDRVGSAVGQAHYDAGALKESTFKKLKEKGIEIKEIARFPNVTKPWISRKGLDEKTFIALQTSLLELKEPSVLKKLKKEGFLASKDADYNRIRAAFDRNDDFFE